MEVHLIWAQDENGGIGHDGKLPWHIPEDLKNFKSITLNSVIIMGRKTWESLPFKPLPGRRNIVLSKTKKIDTETYTNLDKCLNQLKNEKIEKIFVIGGRSIYQLFYNIADYLHITNVKLINKNINEFFPISAKKFKENFKQISRVDLNQNANYEIWKRKK